MENISEMLEKLKKMQAEGVDPSEGVSESHTSDSGYSHGGNGTNYDTQNNGHW